MGTLGRVFLVMLNAIDQVSIFPAAPLWAFIIILLDVIIISNLTARWSGTTAVAGLPAPPPDRLPPPER